MTSDQCLYNIAVALETIAEELKTMNDMKWNKFDEKEETYKAKIKELETQLENWQHNAVHGDEGL